MIKIKYFISKIVGVIFLFSFLLALCIPLKADASPNSLPPESGNLVIHKLVLDDIADVGEAGDGTANVQIPENARRYAGVEFTVWRVNGDASMSLEEARKNLIAGSDKTAVTDINGEASVHLDSGNYYIEETGNWGYEIYSNGDISKELVSIVPIEPFFVSVPMTNPEGNGWLEEVHVYPKMQSVQIDKFVHAAGGNNLSERASEILKKRPVSTDVSFGWTIAASLPYSIGPTINEEIVINDILEPYFQIQMETLRVYAVEKGRNLNGQQIVLNNNDYHSGFENGSRTFSVALTEQGIKKLYKEDMGRLITDMELILQYDSSLQNDAPQGVMLHSGAELIYSVNYRETGNVSNEIKNYVIQEPAVYTGRIRLLKIDEKDGNALSGAKFGLAASKSDALAGDFLDIQTSGDDGYLNFSGVSYGQPGDSSHTIKDGIDFWIVELEAPQGYNKIKDPFKVSFDFQGDPVMEGENLFAFLKVYNVREDGNTETEETQVTDQESDSQKVESTGEKETSVNKDSSGKKPKTGDNTRIMIVVVIAGASAIFYLITAKRGKHN